MININQKPVIIGHFPSGEQKLRYTVSPNTDYTVEWIYEQEDELITLLYLCRHIQTQGGRLNILSIPYLPNARMDRVMNPDEVFTLKYFSELINALGFRKVYIDNPHSPVSLALIDRGEDASFSRGQLHHNSDIILNLIPKLKLSAAKDILFYPDNSCAKKYEGILTFPYLTGHKHRDWHTGKILSLELAGAIPSAPFDVLIIDDICSYGTTVLHSARKLKEIGAAKIYLYVTHCENSILQGELLRSGLLEKIYTRPSLFTMPCPPLIEILNDEFLSRDTLHKEADS